MEHPRTYSAVDVNIYSSGGPGTEKIRGQCGKVPEIGACLREYLGVDVDKITEDLRKMALQGPSEEMEGEDRGAR